MLYDIVHQQRHPVHKFFKGLLTDAMSPRQAPRRDLIVARSSWPAPVRSKSPTWSSSGAAFGPSGDAEKPGDRRARPQRAVADQSHLAGRGCTDPDYKGVTMDLNGRLKAAQAQTTEAIIGWTAANLQFSQAPLDMEAATRIEHRGRS